VFGIVRHTSRAQSSHDQLETLFQISSKHAAEFQSTQRCSKKSQSQFELNFATLFIVVIVVNKLFFASTNLKQQQQQQIKQ
jgi:hypothetical protein